MNTTKRDWRRVSKARRCPVCEKPDWCLYAGPADAPEAAICARVESPRRIGEAGWLHRLRPSVTAWPPWERTIRRAVRLAIEARGGPDLGAMAARWRLPEDSPRLARLAACLALSPRALWRLSAGWSPERRCWSFPMTDAAGAVQGIRLRAHDGRKWSVRGGKEGLFIPSGLQPGGRLAIAEGPSDTAALLDLGLSAVGRPSCSGGTRHVVELVRRLQPQEVVIVSDRDQPDARGRRPGQDGAERLAAALLAYIPDVRVITPPQGTKDARAWLRAGATPGDVQRAIQAAEPRRLKVSAAMTKRRRHDARPKQSP